MMAVPRAERPAGGRPDRSPDDVRRTHRRPRPARRGEARGCAPVEGGAGRGVRIGREATPAGAGGLARPDAGSLPATGPGREGRARAARLQPPATRPGARRRDGRLNPVPSTDPRRRRRAPFPGRPAARGTRSDARQEGASIRISVAAAQPATAVGRLGPSIAGRRPTAPPEIRRARNSCAWTPLATPLPGGSRRRGAPGPQAHDRQRPGAVSRRTTDRGAWIVDRWTRPGGIALPTAAERQLLSKRRQRERVDGYRHVGAVGATELLGAAGRNLRLMGSAAGARTGSSAIIRRARAPARHDRGAASRLGTAPPRGLCR